MKHSVNIASHPYEHCSARISVNSATPIKDGPPLTLMIMSGACYLQTYMTIAECEELVAALNNAIESAS